MTVCSKYNFDLPPTLLRWQYWNEAKQLKRTTQYFFYFYISYNLTVLAITTDYYSIPAFKLLHYNCFHTSSTPYPREEIWRRGQECWTVIGKTVKLQEEANKRLPRAYIFLLTAMCAARIGGVDSILLKYNAMCLSLDIDRLTSVTV